MSIRMHDETTSIRLYCFPFAGGSAKSYQSWARLLPPGVEVVPVELPGRGKRFGEPLLGNYSALVESLCDEVAEDLDRHGARGRPARYAGFGHSAGATWNFAVCQRLSERLRQPPVHCFFSAGTPPHIGKKPRAGLSDAALLQELAKLAGTPPEVLQEPELLQLFLPVIRADLAAYEQSQAEPARRLDCPFTLFAASADEISPQSVWSWGEYSSRPVRKVLLQGDHFSILHAPAEMIKRMAQDLAPLLASAV